MMYRMVVIDDEILVRRGICSSIDWRGHGIEIAGEATDGRSGLELIRRAQPHIVLTDIRMPHMDGLELIRIVREDYPRAKILILSVLEDFQTVREALRLGVTDYVQKLMMTPEELLGAVLKIKRTLVEEAGSPAGSESLRTAAATAAGDGNELPAPAPDRSAAASAADGGNAPPSSARPEPPSRRRFFAGAAGAAGDARDADGPRSEGERQPSADSGGFLDHALLKAYLQQLEQDGEEDNLAAFDTLFPMPGRIRAGCSEQAVREGVYHWVSALTLFLEERGCRLPSALPDESPFEAIRRLETYAELRDWCVRLHQVARSMLNERSRSQRAEITKAVQYLQRHYMNPVRVKEVADRVNLSENYFSYVFTKETGKPFSQYLQETRVEKAKELLAAEEIDWMIAGERVGFDNPKYFTKVFKKYVGTTPAQYAKARRNAAAPVDRAPVM